MPLITFLSTDPQLRLLQFLLLVTAVTSVYLVLFVTRDVILRCSSFWAQFLAIALVAVLPVFGFLLYLLIRPSRTLKDREMEEMLEYILDTVRGRKEGKKLKAPEEGTDDT